MVVLEKQREGTTFCKGYLGTVMGDTKCQKTTGVRKRKKLPKNFPKHGDQGDPSMGGNIFERVKEDQDQLIWD